MVLLQAVSKPLSSRAWLERGPRDFHWIRARGSGTGHRERRVCCVCTVTASRDHRALGSPSARRVNAAGLSAELTEGVDLQNIFSMTQAQVLLNGDVFYRCLYFRLAITLEKGLSISSLSTSGSCCSAPAPLAGTEHPRT